MTAAHLIMQSITAALAQRPARPGPAWRMFEINASTVIAVGLTGRVDHVDAISDGLRTLYLTAREEEHARQAETDGFTLPLVDESPPASAAPEKAPPTPAGKGTGTGGKRERR